MVAGGWGIGGKQAKYQEIGMYLTFLLALHPAKDSHNHRLTTLEISSDTSEKGVAFFLCSIRQNLDQK